MWKALAAANPFIPLLSVKILRSFILPKPPLITNGTSQISKTYSHNSLSKPNLVPSLSIDVKNTLPIPKSTAFFIHNFTSIPVGSLPLLTNTSQFEEDFFFASTDNTIDWEPNSLANIFKNCGFSTAAVLIPILSAPFKIILLASSIVLIPPQTVIGKKIFFEISFTNLTALFLPYKLATSSIHYISSIPLL